MSTALRWVIEPGFFSSTPVRTALVLGGLVAIVSAVTGTFTVLRGQSFGGHALTDVSTAGGSGALLLGLSPLTGFIFGGLLGGAAMETIGTRRRRRDLATGVVLGASIGLAALFLYLDATSAPITGATQQILFGSIFLIEPATVPFVVGLALLALVLIAALYRPLLFASISEEIAAARGIRLRLVGMIYALTLALAVGLSSIAIGTILSTALLVGPPAIAMRLSHRMSHTLTLACAIGVIATWLGILLAYDSYYWGSGHNGWPVSFFIVVCVLFSYLLAGLRHSAERSTRSERR